MHFQNPWFLALIPIVLVLLIYSKKQEHVPAFVFPSDDLLKNMRPSFKVRLREAMVFMRIVSLVLIILALGRPQQMIEESVIETEGIDIVLALDTSSSMLAEDFELRGTRSNRLDVVKEVVKDFIANRTNDRIALIAFAARAYTVSPLTLDYGWLMQNLERVTIGMIEDGTAIGSGLSSALIRLKDTVSKSKVVVLLTDGRNNAGRISPLMAAEAAAALNMKVYTIGAGTRGLAPYPAKDPFGNTVYRPVKIEIDEDVLKEIADKTGAQYFRATDTGSLREIYKEIDQLEKTTMEQKGYREYRELFHLFLVPGLFMVILELILNNTFLRRIP